MVKAINWLFQTRNNNIYHHCFRMLYIFGKTCRKHWIIHLPSFAYSQASHASLTNMQNLCFLYNWLCNSFLWIFFALCYIAWVKRTFTFIDIVDQIHKVAYTRIISHTSQHSPFFFIRSANFLSWEKPNKKHYYILYTQGKPIRKLVKDGK